MAIIGKLANDDNVEVIQISGEVDPHTGNFTALDYSVNDRNKDFPVITKKDFENLVSFIEAKIDDQTKMSVIEPEIIRSILSEITLEEPGKYLH